MINSMSSILLTFREKKIAFMMDIAAFFHQVLVDEKDADVFRYLWFDDETLSTYVVLRFLAHIFGSAASSVVTSFVLRHHAEQIRHLFSPEVYEIIRRLFYVDDGSGGADE